MQAVNEYVEYVQDLLSPFARVMARSMFGGHGLYCDGVMMALIAYNELYFKADAQAAAYFKTFGSEPFVYQGKNKLIALSYWKVTSDVLDDQDELQHWFTMAREVAIQTANKKQISKHGKTRILE